MHDGQSKWSWYVCQALGGLRLLNCFHLVIVETVLTDELFPDHHRDHRRSMCDCVGQTVRDSNVRPDNRFRGHRPCTATLHLARR